MKNIKKKKRTNWPKVSIVIPTYNSQEFIGKVLDSIFKQNYPKDKLEVIVVDGGSGDETLKITQKYPVKILHNKKRLAEPAKTLGFKHSTGEFFFYLDSDAELVSKNWFKEIITPLLDDEKLAGSFTRYLPSRKQNAFNRYVSYNPLQLWSMLSYLLPSLDKVTIDRKKGFNIIKIDSSKSPPIGICLYRKKFLDKVILNPETYNYVDIAIPLELAELGYDRLAYVEKAGLYHRRSGIMREFLRQKRDVTITYLPVLGERKFDYIDFNNPFDLLKIIFWTLWVNLLIPSIIVGIYKSIKYKDLAGMYEFPTNFILTNYIIYLFISDPNGRKLIKKILFGDRK